MVNLTRIEKWKVYRNEIAKNISLQSSILKSNEKLAILNSRLLKVFPNYHKKYINKKEFLFDINITDTDMPNLFDTSEAEKIISIVNENESEEKISLQYVDKFNFSSGQLDALIEEVKMWKLLKIKSHQNQKNFQIGKVQKVNLKNSKGKNK